MPGVWFWALCVRPWLVRTGADDVPLPAPAALLTQLPSASSVQVAADPASVFTEALAMVSKPAPLCPEELSVPRRKLLIRPSEERGL